MIESVLDPREGGNEESKLLHFVRFQEKSLWKSPDLTFEPIRTLGQPGDIRIKPGKGEPIRTQHLTLHQKVTNQTRRLPFLNFSRDNTLYKQCNPELRAPPYSCCDGIGGSPSWSLVIKTLLLLHRILAPWWSLGDFATWA